MDASKPEESQTVHPHSCVFCMGVLEYHYEHHYLAEGQPVAVQFLQEGIRTVSNRPNQLIKSVTCFFLFVLFCFWCFANK